MWKSSKLLVVGLVLLGVGLVVAITGADHPHRVWPFGGRLLLLAGIVLLVLWLFERERTA